MTSKVYGYAEGRAYDVYTAVLNRVRGDEYANVPLHERSWMFDRWIWTTLCRVSKSFTKQKNLVNFDKTPVQLKLDTLPGK